MQRQTRPTLAPSSPNPLNQNRPLHLSADQLTEELAAANIHISAPPENPRSSHYLGISPDRSARSPSIIAAPTTHPSEFHARVKRFPFDYRNGPTPSAISAAIAHLQLDAAPLSAKAQTVELIHSLWRMYTSTEAIDLHLHLSVRSHADALCISSPYLFFDDAAYKSANRRAGLHAKRTPPAAVEREAEEAGIVYVRLGSEKEGKGKGLVGTLVNGAGLAMNTNDVLNARLLPSTQCANFLDTGGKATASTISTSFKLILSDERVGVVFVNIFGGLTLCDMIAEGIVLAFKEVGVGKPVVVRLRGTNEEEGRRVLEEARLPIHAFDGFEEAVGKVGELVEEGK